MSIRFVLGVIVSILGLSFNPSTHDRTSETSYRLRVESSVPGNPRIEFLGAFSMIDSAKNGTLTTIEKVTPFQMEFATSYFLGVFQDKSGKNQIRVSIASVENGQEVRWTKGQGPVNVLLIDRGIVGYGLPTLAGNPRMR